MHKISFLVALITMVCGFNHASFAIFGFSPPTCTDKNMPALVKKGIQDKLESSSELDESDSDFRPCTTKFHDIKDLGKDKQYEITATTKCKVNENGKIHPRGKTEIELKKKIHYNCAIKNKKVELQNLPQMKINLEEGTRYHLIAEYDEESTSGE
ncbi:MAG: hypothetical protein K2Q34_06405 [Alphaproteobacteria bacterium]|nr:hypothetical protein [Alphaproteobacteria bacterium]